MPEGAAVTVSSRTMPIDKTIAPPVKLIAGELRFVAPGSSDVAVVGVAAIGDEVLILRQTYATEFVLVDPDGFAVKAMLVSGVLPMTL